MTAWSALVRSNHFLRWWWANWPSWMLVLKCLYLVISLNAPRWVSSGWGGMAIAWVFSFVRILDYKCSILVYQTHWSDGMQCSREHTAWKVNLIQTSNLSSSDASSWPIMERKLLHWVNARDCPTQMVEVMILLSSVGIEALRQRSSHCTDNSSFC